MDGKMTIYYATVHLSVPNYLICLVSRSELSEDVFWIFHIIVEETHCHPRTEGVCNERHLKRRKQLFQVLATGKNDRRRVCRSPVRKIIFMRLDILGRTI